MNKLERERQRKNALKGYYKWMDIPSIPKIPCQHENKKRNHYAYSFCPDCRTHLMEDST